MATTRCGRRVYHTQHPLGDPPFCGASGMGVGKVTAQLRWRRLATCKAGIVTREFLAHEEADGSKAELGGRALGISEHRGREIPNWLVRAGDFGIGKESGGTARISVALLIRDDSRHQILRMSATLRGIQNAVDLWALITLGCVLLLD